jgi:hypothetical protein
VGFTAKLARVNIEAFAELIPVSGILPDAAYFDLAGPTGGRFYF